MFIVHFPSIKSFSQCGEWRNGVICSKIRSFDKDSNTKLKRITCVICVVFEQVQGRCVLYTVHVATLREKVRTNKMTVYWKNEGLWVDAPIINEWFETISMSPHS